MGCILIKLKECVQCVCPTVIDAFLERIVRNVIADIMHMGKEKLASLVESSLIAYYVMGSINVLNAIALLNYIMDIVVQSVKRESNSD